MYSSRLFQVFLVGLSILVAARASWFHLGAVEERQISIPPIPISGEPSSSAAPSSTPPSSSSEASPSPTSSDPPSSSSSSSSSSEPASPSTPSPTESSSVPPTSTPESSQTSSLPPSTSDSSSVPESTTTPPPESSSTTKGGGKPTKTPTPVTITTVVDFTSTDAQGHATTGQSSSVIVSTPALTGHNGGSSNSGLSSTQRNTVIGVVVGVGGAIILAVVGVVFWRLRNKKRSQREENEELMNYGPGFGGPGAAEKSTSASGPASSPFQSTLESYHAPTQTNAASNF